MHEYKVPRDILDDAIRFTDAATSADVDSGHRCPACKGRGRVTNGKNKLITCGQCGGTGRKGLGDE